MSSQHDWQCSAPFIFLVDGRTFYIHRDLVSSVSPPLDKLMNDNFEESQKERAELSSVDHETFERFVQWIYSRSYTPAKPIPRRTEGSKPHEDAAVNPDRNTPRTQFDLGYQEVSWNFPVFNENNQDSWSPELTYSFTSLQTYFTEMRFRFLEDEGRADLPSNKDHDFSEVLLSHVKLYVFADEWDIQLLQRHILHQLHKMLKVFVVDAQTTPDLVTSIKFVYENTLPKSNTQEAMRSLFSRFVFCRMNKMVGVKEFQGLFQIEDFATDFCRELDTYFTFTSATNEWAAWR